MKKKILVFKNDRLGDLVHGYSAINNLILNNPDKEIIIFLSKLSKDFFFLFEAKNTRLQILNYHLTLFEKIKIFFFILNQNIQEIYIFSFKNFYFLLPPFFKRIKFFAVCMNGVNNYRRPNLFLRKFLYKFLINDRETTKKRLSAHLLQYLLTSNDKNLKKNSEFISHIPKSDALIKYLPKDYFFIFYKKRFFDKLCWEISEFHLLINEITKYQKNVVLVKDIEIDVNNALFKKKYKTYDFKTKSFHNNEGNILFLDNIEGKDLLNVIKLSKKVISPHGTMTSLAFLCKRPVLDLFYCKIDSSKDYYGHKNAFHEFKPNYQGYDFIIPRNDINKTLRKIKFSLIKDI